MICHHCSYEKEMKTKCRIKGYCEFIMYGPGVEKIFEEVKEIFLIKGRVYFLATILKKSKKQKICLKKLMKIK